MNGENSIFPFEHCELDAVADGGSLLNSFYTVLIDYADRSPCKQLFFPPYARSIVGDVADTFGTNPVLENRFLAEAILSPIGQRPTLVIRTIVTKMHNMSVTFTEMSHDDWFYQCYTPAYGRPANELIFINNICYLPQVAPTPDPYDPPSKAWLDHEIACLIIVAFRSMMIKLQEHFKLVLQTTPEPVFDDSLSIVGMDVMNAKEAADNADRYRKLSKIKETLRLLDDNVRKKYDALIVIEKVGLGPGLKKTALSSLRATGIMVDYSNLSEIITQLREAFDMKFPNWRAEPPDDRNPSP